MIISLENLSLGLAWWRSDSKWGRDVMKGEVHRPTTCGQKILFGFENT